MTTGTRARVLRHSTSAHSPPLVTFHCRLHQFVLAEFNTHRAFSRSDRSTRAVPFPRLAAEVREDPAVPVAFLRAKVGMGGGEPMAGIELELARQAWDQDATQALANAGAAEARGEARESVNARILPYIYTESVRTCCEPGLLNYFGLRLDAHARPEIRALAEAMWAAWNESEPRRLEPGEWHLPLVDEEDREAIHRWSYTNEPADYCTTRVVDLAKMVSAARCARQSFTYGKVHTIEDDLALYDRLVRASPMHLGPLEHQATPDAFRSMPHEGYWEHPELHGNLPGWVQFRKTIPGEAVAPLPEGYR